ncbi:MAG: CDC27 family protein [Bacteroidales bacterium]
MKNLYLLNKRNPWFWTFVAIILISFFALPIMSLSAGNSGDEDSFQVPQGGYVLNYFTSGGLDSTCLTFKNLRFYGSSPDVIAEFFNRTFHIDNIHVTRHIFNSLLGWLAILIVGFMVYQIAGWRAGVFALLFLLLSPRFVGHSFNNTKDIPFATAMVGAVYCIFIFLRNFPKINIWSVVGIILFSAFAISVRIGGILLFAYFAFFAFLMWILQAVRYKKNKKIFFTFDKKTFQKLLLWGLGICVLAYIIGILIWPFALQAPIKNTIAAFAEISKFSVSLRQLFEGKMQWSQELPWYYTSKFILMTTPSVVILGVILFITLIWRDKKNLFWHFIIFFTFFFPVFWIVYSKANVYGGWRHALFAYPSMVMAAALGVDAAIRNIQKKHFKIFIITLVCGLLIKPLIHIVKSHPYEYIYFNEFAGGIKKAYGNYEMDYYYHSTREAAEWVRADIQQNGAPDSTRKTRVVSFHLSSVAYFLRKDTATISTGFVRWNERAYSDWDYAIFTITGMNPELLKNKKAFPPKNTVHQIKVDGIPIAIVLKRNDRSDFYAHKILQKKDILQSDIIEAKTLLHKALKIDPYNEQAFADLISIYQDMKMLDSTFIFAKTWVGFNKGNPTALNELANCYYQMGDYNSAILAGSSISKLNTRDVSGLWIVANAQVQLQQTKDALNTLDRLLAIRGDFKPAYQLMAQIYMQMGNQQQAQRIISAMNRLP